jgi:hypothetical protein
MREPKFKTQKYMRENLMKRAQTKIYRKSTIKSEGFISSLKNNNYLLFHYCFIIV